MANPVFIKAQSGLEYLGNVDAKTEWDHNRDLARHIFLHTDAYSSYLKDDSLILLGRTGVGKTAILLFMGCI